MEAFPRLFRTQAHQHRRNGADENLEIQTERPAVYVIQIKLHPIAEIFHLVAPANLPQTSQPGFHAQTAALSGIFEFGDLINRQRARADQTHVSHQYVHQLRELVDAAAPEPTSKTSNARIV